MERTQTLSQFIEKMAESKRCFLSGILVIAFTTSMLPNSHWLNAIKNVLIGVIWHIVNAETASVFWLRLGLSKTASQWLATVAGMLVGLGICWLGYWINLPTGTTEKWLLAHRWARELPYPAIIILGLFLPFGGVVIGVLIAQQAEIPKPRAIVIILAVNLAKLYGWGRGLAFFLGPFMQ